MTISVLAFVARAPHLTREQFKDHYENHMRLFATLFDDDLLPVTNRRQYITEGRQGLPQLGSVADTVYDCYTTNTFRDQDHYDNFMKRYNEVYQTISEDEKKFLNQDVLHPAYVDIEEGFGKTTNRA